MSVRILIADDEERWRRIVGDFLRNEGYQVLEAADGLQALELLRGDESVDLVILDIMMPNLDGLETCRRIRNHSSVPVMIVTARDGEDDEVRGFDCGADEFIAKPLRFPIFMARVKALLKRTAATAELQVGQLRINIAAHSVLAGQQPVSLTPREFDLLVFLMQHRGNVMSRKQILDAVWKTDCYYDVRTVDTHMKNLRMKLGPFGTMLKTVRGNGYLLEG